MKITFFIWQETRWVKKENKPHKRIRAIPNFQKMLDRENSLFLLKRTFMLDKAKVLGTVNQLPDKFTIDELLDRLIFMNKVEQGLQDIKEGKVYSNEEARQRLSKWLK